MLLGEGRALTRHGHREAADVQANRIDLPLADNGLAVWSLRNVRGGAVEAKEDVRFLENQRLGRVHVLARIFLLDELPPRKGDDPPLPVAHREHQPPTEAVVALVTGSSIRRLDHTRLGEFLRRIAVLLRPGKNRRNADRCIAD